MYYVLEDLSAMGSSEEVRFAIFGYNPINRD